MREKNLPRRGAVTALRMMVVVHFGVRRVQMDSLHVPWYGRGFIFFYAVKMVQFEPGKHLGFACARPENFDPLHRLGLAKSYFLP